MFQEFSANLSDMLTHEFSVKYFVISLISIFMLGCGSIFIRSPVPSQTRIYTPFTLEAQKNDQWCSFDNNSFRAYLDKNTRSQLEISNSFTRPLNSNIWTAPNFNLPIGSHSLTVEGSFSGIFCQRDSDTRQLSVSANPYTAGFIGLGLLPGMIESTASAISDDGNVIVGSSGPTLGSLGQVAFRWTENSGMISMGMPAGADSSRANAVSANGDVIVGRVTYNIGAPNYRERAFRWTSPSGYVDLGDLPGGLDRSDAGAVSRDGTVVAGHSSSGGSEIFRWTTSSPMVGLGDLPGGVVGAFASGIADNGTIVGLGTPNFGEVEAVHWTQSGGLVGIGDFQTVSRGSVAYGVSNDGTITVGHGNPTGNIADAEAARWVGQTIYHLGYLPGHTVSSAHAVSGDGSTIVGFSRGANGPSVAFRWTITTGMESIASLLNAQGVAIPGWTLEVANGVSHDGKVIAGYGTSPTGHIEAWRAILP